MSFFLPDDYRETVLDYTPEYLKALGKRAILCDIDNTLVTYDDPEPTEPIRGWLASMKAAGITVGFISNNTAERVNLFNRELGFFAAPDAHKPLTGGFKRFLAETGYQKNEIAHVGDQIFTDVLMAHTAGVTALLVPPIKDKLTFAFRFKRALEKPLLWVYFRKTKKSK
ncbi:MAG: YqeG family HAD IIIA-type phosphatase [Clostridia bacterium]|nr:YqeG family HAD IIIA-type phosphatase [Clostridia bacterium]